MGRINTVLLDFDGTLMDTNDLILNSWQHTFRTITGKDGDVEIIKKTFGEILAKSMADFFPDFPVDDGIEIYRNYQIGRFADDISLFPNMKELAVKLKAGGYKLAVVTSRLRKSTVDGLDAFDLTRYMDAIVTAEDCEKHKPDPEPILAALRKLGVKPENAMMIGDSKYDVGCANNAGVTSVLVEWAIAKYDREKEGIFRPDYIISKPEEVWDILEKER